METDYEEITGIMVVCIVAVVMLLIIGLMIAALSVDEERIENGKEPITSDRDGLFVMLSATIVFTMIALMVDIGLGLVALGLFTVIIFVTIVGIAYIKDKHYVPIWERITIFTSKDGASFKGRTLFCKKMKGEYICYD